MTTIEWTQRPGTRGETWNPIRAVSTFKESRADTTGDIGGKIGWHCEHVNDDCRRCYAERLNVKPGASGGTGFAYKPGHRKNGDVAVYLDEKVLLKPLHWKSPRTIFVCSMTDLFADFVEDAWLDRIFAVAAMCPQHTFIMLTKRPKRMRSYMETAEQRIALQMCALGEPKPGQTMGHYFTGCAPRGRVGEGIVGVTHWPLPNVWLGTSCGTQKTADEFIPDLLATPAAIRFVSVEPMTGPVTLGSMCDGFKFYDALTGARWHDAPEGQPSYSDRDGAKLDWVICGGESGPDARPMHPDWARELRDQCVKAGVPFFFKQWGRHLPADWVRTENGTEAHFPDGEEIAVFSDGWDIIFCAAQDHMKGPAEHIWRNYWSSGLGLLTKIKGTKSNCRKLDGRTHDAFPEVSP